MNFWGYPSLTPLFEGNPFTQGHEILSQKTRFMILACTVLIQSQSTMDKDRQTDERLDDG